MVLRNSICREYLRDPRKVKLRSPGAFERQPDKSQIIGALVDRRQFLGQVPEHIAKLPIGWPDLAAYGAAAERDFEMLSLVAVGVGFGLGDCHRGQHLGYCDDAGLLKALAHGGVCWLLARVDDAAW
jgi:hypothetical protein